jgi:DoxX-like family
MNIALWIVQGLLTVLFVIGGSTKVFMFEKIAQQVASNKALPREMWTAIGIFEVLCALVLVIPGAMGKFPILTAVAASCLAVEALLFAGLHYSYGEYSPMTFSLVLAALAFFVAYGRFMLKPL